VHIKYNNIKQLYNITSVADKYIFVKERDVMKKVYLYEIEPVTFLNFSIDIQSNILNLYNEFLRELNLNFQIYISNKKVNIQNYIQNIKQAINSLDNPIVQNLSERYVNSISEELENQSIFTTKYYIVISVSTNEDINMDNVDNIISKLNFIGCNVNKICDKNILKNILYESINKEVIV